MSLAATVQNRSAVIQMPPRFDFRAADDFNRVVNEAVQRSESDEIVVDLQATEYVGSAGLGMLLILRDRARGKGKPVVLASAHGAVRTVLRVAHFEKLFEFR